LRVRKRIDGDAAVYRTIAARMARNFKPHVDDGCIPQFIATTENL